MASASRAMGQMKENLHRRCQHHISAFSLQLANLIHLAADLLQSKSVHNWDTTLSHIMQMSSCLVPALCPPPVPLWCPSHYRNLPGPHIQWTPSAAMPKCHLADPFRNALSLADCCWDDIYQADTNHKTESTRLQRCMSESAKKQLGSTFRIDFPPCMD